MLLGLHAGDSLGVTLEFEEARPISDWHREITGGGAFQWRPGQATDDTDLMVCVLKALDKTHGFAFDRLKKIYSIGLQAILLMLATPHVEA